MKNSTAQLIRYLRDLWDQALRWVGIRVPPPVALHLAGADPAQEPEPPTPALGLQAYATVVIPALNEAKRIAEVVAFALADAATAEVIVIDDSSIDNTAELARQAGARVITSSMLGKGSSMRDGIAPAQCQLLVYLDGDLAGLRPHIITDLCAPLLRGEADFVKARFGRGGGRVTELTAKPMLQIFFPEVAHFTQPLGGIIAARKTLLQSLKFEEGYGVDVGLLLDAHLAGAALAEVDIGSLDHDSQPLNDLVSMANEVAKVIFSRARAAGRLHVEQIAAMYESQSQAAAEIGHVLTRRKQRHRLLLLDMDGTITAAHYATELARATGHEAALTALRGEYRAEDSIQSERIAAQFQYVHKRLFEQVAHSLPLRPGVIELVNQMRRRGFMVGVVSHSYFVAADILRRRIFADFAMAHTLVFDNDVCTGQLRINPAFVAPLSRAGDAPVACKSQVLRHFTADPQAPAIDLVWVVSNNPADLPLMRLADRAFAIAPASPESNASSAQIKEPEVTIVTSFGELLALLPNHEMVAEAA